ncbi:MAG: hypothetical protein IKC63_06635 [Clostridia bacterium]|nr:hypothetical protein [Clostridia bacterium]
MEDNRILEAARNNKRKGHEYEKKESVRSNLLSSAIAIVVGIIIFVIEYLAKGSFNVSLIVVAMTAACVQALYEGFRNKKVHLIIIGGIETIIFVISFLIFISQVIAQ